MYRIVALLEIARCEDSVKDALKPGALRSALFTSAGEALERARISCRNNAAAAYLETAAVHIGELENNAALNGHTHEKFALTNLSEARDALLNGDCRYRSLTVLLDAANLIHTLPPDDESPARPEAFIAHVRASTTSSKLTAVLEEVYFLAAEGEWAGTLADVNMLVFSLRHNTHVASLVHKNGSIAKILGKLSSSTAHAYWVWLEKLL